MLVAILPADIHLDPHHVYLEFPRLLILLATIHPSFHLEFSPATKSSKTPPTWEAPLDTGDRCRPWEISGSQRAGYFMWVAELLAFNGIWLELYGEFLRFHHHDHDQSISFFALFLMSTRSCHLLLVGLAYYIQSKKLDRIRSKEPRTEAWLIFDCLICWEL